MEGKLREKINRHCQLFGQALSAFGSHDGLVHAGNMAFLGMLAFFPFVIFLVALSGMLGQTQTGQDTIAFLLTNLPEEVTGVVAKPIAGILKNSSGEILTVSIVFALWTASSGVDAARSAVVSAYGSAYRPKLWRAKLESLAIVIITAVLALFGTATLVIGPALLSVVESYVELPSQVENVWRVLRFGIGPVSLFVALYGFYFILSPRAHFERLFYLPGTLVSLSAWLVTATGFSTFLSAAGDFDVTYGGLAGVLIAQLFFFVVSLGFILGAELNAVYVRVNCQTKSSDTAAQTVDRL